MSYFHWIVGGLLGLIWFSRLAAAAFGMRRLADLSQAQWDRTPATRKGNPRVSIIVPARNEEDHIEQTLARMLQLDYANYEVLAVNDLGEECQATPAIGGRSLYIRTAKALYSFSEKR